MPACPLPAVLLQDAAGRDVGARFHGGNGPAPAGNTDPPPVPLAPQFRGSVPRHGSGHPDVRGTPRLARSLGAEEQPWSVLLDRELMRPGAQGLREQGDSRPAVTRPAGMLPHLSRTTCSSGALGCTTYEPRTPNKADISVDTVHTAFGRTNRAAPGRHDVSEKRLKKNFVPKSMSSCCARKPGPWTGVRHPRPSRHSRNEEPNKPSQLQAEGPPARDLTPPPQHT